MPGAENLRSAAAHCHQGADEADAAVGSIQAAQARIETVLNDIATIRGEITGLSVENNPVLGQVVLAAAFARTAGEEMPPGELAGRAIALADKIETAGNAVINLGENNLLAAESALTELKDVNLPNAAQGYGRASGILDEGEREAISIVEGS